MSGEPEIRVFDDAAATSRAAAEAIADALIAAADARGRADWATTGGSTPVGIYRELAGDPLKSAVPWSVVHIWWGDDRFVPRDHPLSNVMPLDQAGLPLPIENVHAPWMTHAIGEALGLGSVAMDYEAELRAADLELAPSGFPILDVVLVGIGADGHVLSVFPNSPLFDADAWVTAVPAPTHIEPHVARISLHPRILEAARLPMVVAHGESKAAILASVLGGERDERRWPAQVARREGAVWFLDRAAAAGLPPALLD